MPLGLSRAFVLCEDEGATQSSMEHDNVVVSARMMDADLLWQRMEQIFELCTYVGCCYFCCVNAGFVVHVDQNGTCCTTTLMFITLKLCVCVCVCEQEKENFSVVVNGVNKGGLTAYIAGYPVFVPISQLKRRDDGEKWDIQTLQAEYLRKRVDIALFEIDQEQKRIVCSELKAVENNVLRQLEVGQVVTGRVRKLERFGAFVGLEGARVSGLIHISNISNTHIDGPEVWIYVSY